MVSTEMTDSQVREALARAAALRWVAARVRAAQAETDAVLVEALGPGGRRYATDASGREVGTVSVTRPRPAEARDEVYVADEDALVSWLIWQGRLDEVRTVVAPWALEGILRRAGESGELPDGVAVRTVVPEARAPHVSVRMTPSQEDTLTQALTTPTALAGLLGATGVA